MNFFWQKKAETPEPIPEPVPTPTSSSAPLWQQISDRLKQHTLLPMVRFELSSDAPGLLDCKVGGSFYLPAGMDVPRNQDGEPLYLLAQLNFAQMPALPDFPQTGLLQFFIDGRDDCWGINWDDPADPAGFRVRYIETVPDTVPAAEISTTPWDESTCMPMEETDLYRLIPTADTQAIPYDDFRFEDCLQRYCSDLIGAGGLSALDDDVMDELIDHCDTPACQVGGYPFFTQSDPRSDEEWGILLFQLDSVENILWGDVGVANFFIRPADLKARDFSHVWYNWDCC